MRCSPSNASKRIEHNVLADTGGEALPIDSVEDESTNRLMRKLSSSSLPVLFLFVFFSYCNFLQSDANLPDRVNCRGRHSGEHFGNIYMNAKTPFLQASIQSHICHAPLTSNTNPTSQRLISAAATRTTNR